MHSLEPVPITAEGWQSLLVAVKGNIGRLTEVSGGVQLKGVVPACDAIHEERVNSMVE